MPVPFRDVTTEEDNEVAGYLKFIDEPDGRGIRSALFMISSRGEPLDFSFTRIDIHSGFLWRAGEARRQAITSLMKALFQAAHRVPTIIFTLADEVPRKVFTEDLEVGVPLCRIATAEMAVQSDYEEEERLSDSVYLFWINGQPLSESPARSLIDTLNGRNLLIEPFERASIGIQEAFSS